MTLALTLALTIALTLALTLARYRNRKLRHVLNLDTDSLEARLTAATLYYGFIVLTVATL